MKLKTEKVKIILFLFLFPLLTIADAGGRDQGIPAAKTLKSIADNILRMIQIIPGLLTALALSYFLYGVFSYVSEGADEKKRREGKNTIVYGIIGLFVMTSVWGLIALARDIFKI